MVLRNKPIDLENTMLTNKAREFMREEADSKEGPSNPKVMIHALLGHIDEADKIMEVLDEALGTVCEDKGSECALGTVFGSCFVCGIRDILQKTRAVRKGKKRAQKVGSC